MAASHGIQAPKTILIRVDAEGGAVDHALPVKDVLEALLHFIQGRARPHARVVVEHCIEDPSATGRPTLLEGASVDRHEGRVRQLSRQH
eukprot:10316738-Lingulodinium_polyedra.AAC.1